jgi:DNA modification methylase
MRQPKCDALYPGISGFGRQGEEGNLFALHPTVKPVALVADAILDCSSRGDLVLDAFLGSGATLIAAERTGRCCRGLELDPLYVNTIIRRWQAYAGEDIQLAFALLQVLEPRIEEQRLPKENEPADEAVLAELKSRLLSMGKGAAEADE